MDKSPDAFRTISEVAEVLETPAHVLRFWESRFPQIRPVKRAGGRRYYRPADVALLTGIKRLLHDEGMTIRGVQKILREQGVRHVAGLSGQDVPDETETAEAALEAALAANFGPPHSAPLPQHEAESAQIVALEAALMARQAKIVAETEAVATDEVQTAASESVIDSSAQQEAVATGAQMPPTPPPQSAHPVQASLPFDPDPAPISPDHVELPSAPETAEVGPQPEPAQTKPDIALPATADLPLLDRLRALPPGCLVSARPLRDRLADLASRIAAPPPHAQL